jgi:hypothetical protein
MIKLCYIYIHHIAGIFSLVVLFFAEFCGRKNWQNLQYQDISTVHINMYNATTEIGNTEPFTDFKSRKYNASPTSNLHPLTPLKKLYIIRL